MDVVYQVVINACNIATIEITGTVEDFTYSTGQGPFSIDTPFESSVPDCPVPLFFTIDEIDNKPFSESIFSVHAQLKKFTINTNNVNYAGYTFKVQLTAKIEDSGDTAT